MAENDATLPDGCVARIEVYAEGVRVNLRDGMPAHDFAEMLRMIADAYDSNQMRRTQ